MRRFTYFAILSFTLSISVLLVANAVQQPKALKSQSVDSKTTQQDQPRNEEQERPTHRFDRTWLEAKAKSLSEEAYVPDLIPEDDPLNQLSYDDYKKIQFQRGATIWSKEERNFRMNPLHPGFLFKIPVKLNLVVGGVSRRIFYTSEIFNYDKEQEKLKASQAQGYSGFSVTNPINRDDKWDEFMVFQGGTYFRAVGQDNWYGLSARGLAINTAKPSGEEFPVFKEFWIERPSSSANSLVVHALMDSPSITGAFTFIATPGEHTKIEVKSTLYPRKDIRNFGIAPLTSMFLFNAMDRTNFDDFRPAVHDSDGLLMLKGNDEHIWRSLANPERLQVSVFSDNKLQGFGLMQRARKFSEFEDMEARYHQRPSAWVKPNNDWGEGHVELVEIPTDAEIHDNIVAFWQPKKPLKAGQEASFNYSLFFGKNASIDYKQGRIVKTASGQALGSNSVREFVLDYEADQIPENLSVNASASAGKIVATLTKYIEQTGNLRVVVKFEPGNAVMSELRVSLSKNDKQWGETWLYRWMQ